METFTKIHSLFEDILESLKLYNQTVSTLSFIKIVKLLQKMTQNLSIKPDVMTNKESFVYVWPFFIDFETDQKIREKKCAFSDWWRHVNTELDTYPFQEKENFSLKYCFSNKIILSINRKYITFNLYIIKQFKSSSHVSDIRKQLELSRQSLYTESYLLCTHPNLYSIFAKIQERKNDKSIEECLLILSEVIYEIYFLRPVMFDHIEEQVEQIKEFQKFCDSFVELMDFLYSNSLEAGYKQFYNEIGHL